MRIRIKQSKRVYDAVNWLVFAVGSLFCMYEDAYEDAYFSIWSGRKQEQHGCASKT